MAVQWLKKKTRAGISVQTSGISRRTSSLEHLSGIFTIHQTSHEETLSRFDIELL